MVQLAILVKDKEVLRVERGAGPDPHRVEWKPHGQDQVRRKCLADGLIRDRVNDGTLVLAADELVFEFFLFLAGDLLDNALGRPRRHLALLRGDGLAEGGQGGRSDCRQVLLCPANICPVCRSQFIDELLDLLRCGFGLFLRGPDSHGR
jgi:hypothetical protein